MLCMMTWKIRDGCHQVAVNKFLETQAPLPDGLKQVGRYHSPGSIKGWLVVEGDIELVFIEGKRFLFKKKGICLADIPERRA